MKLSFAIVAGGKATAKEIIAHSKKHNCFWIAADSGAEVLLEANVIPDILVGDLDSISRESLEHIKSVGQTEIFQFFPEKNYSDTYLALQAAEYIHLEKLTELFKNWSKEHQPAQDSILARKLRDFKPASKRPSRAEVTVFGAVGGRVDHSLANIWVAFEFWDNLEIEFRNAKNRVALCSGVTSLSIKPNKKFPYLSILPVSEYIVGLTLAGVRYPLTNQTVSFRNASLLLSNEITGAKAKITSRQGDFLLIRSRD